MKILILTALAALTALPTMQAQTKPTGTGGPGTTPAPVVATAIPAEAAALAAAEQELGPELESIYKMPIRARRARLIAEAEGEYFGTFVPKLAALALARKEAASYVSLRYAAALRRKDKPFAPLPGVPEASELVKLYAFAEWIREYATETDLAAATPREYLPKAYKGDRKFWDSAALGDFFKAARRLDTQSATDAVREKQRGHAVQDEGFVSWLLDRAKDLPTAEAIALVEKEVKALSFAPQTKRRDEILARHLTTLELLQRLSK